MLIHLTAKNNTLFVQPLKILVTKAVKKKQYKQAVNSAGLNKFQIELRGKPTVCSLTGLQFPQRN